MAISLRVCNTHDLAHWDGGKSEWIGVAKIGLVGEWQFGKVLYTFDVIWGQVHFLEFLPVERGVVITVIDDFLQSPTLDFAHLVAVHALNAFIPIHDFLYLFVIIDSF